MQFLKTLRDTLCFHQTSCANTRYEPCGLYMRFEVGDSEYSWKILATSSETNVFHVSTVPESALFGLHLFIRRLCPHLTIDSIWYPSFANHRCVVCRRVGVPGTL